MPLANSVAAPGGSQLHWRCKGFRNGHRSPYSFQAHKLRRGEWVPCTLRVTAWALERLDPASGAVRWRLEYRNMASPAARLLRASGRGDPGRVVALFGRVGRSPRLYACRDLETLVKQMQTAALNKLGITLAGAQHRRSSSLQ